MNKNTLLHFVIFISIICLIAIRLFSNFSAPVVSGINALGCSIAFITLIYNITVVQKERHQIIWILLLLFFIIICVVMTLLIFFDIIHTGNTTNDIVTLLTLLFSLPMNFYMALVTPKCDKDNEK